ncbi:MAG: ABC transporter transmembrane domain-containing protein [Sporichthyaceae bacterium]
MTGRPGRSVRAGGTLQMLARAAKTWRAHPRLAAISVAALLVEQAFVFGLALSVKYIVDHAKGPDAGSGMVALVVAIVLGFAVAAAATLAGRRAMAVASAEISNDVRRELYARLLRLSPSYFLGTSPSRVVKIYQSNVRGVDAGYTTGFLNTVGLAATAVIGVPLLVWLDWRLAAVALVLLVEVVLVAERLQPWSVAANEQLSDSDSRLLRTVQDTMHANQLVRMFNLETELARRFEERLDDHRTCSIRSRSRLSVVGDVAALGVLLAQVAVIALGAHFAVAGDLTVGGLVAFTAILALLSKTVFAGSASSTSASATSPASPRCPVSPSTFGPDPRWPSSAAAGPARRRC